MLSYIFISFYRFREAGHEVW